MKTMSLFGIEEIKSISFDNSEIIRNIMSLHNLDRFDLDCTFSIGQFWRDLPQPKFKTDLYSKSPDVVSCCSTNLPFEDNSLNSIMFDPPFVISGETYKDSKEGSSIISKRFEAYKNFDELKEHYLKTMQESFRILKKDGLLVFKCQDVVASGLNHFSHCFVMNEAIKIGFYPKDLFILLAKSRIKSGKWKQQQHARKHHCYFWVLIKKKNRVKY